MLCNPKKKKKLSIKCTCGTNGAYLKRPVSAFAAGTFLGPFEWAPTALARAGEGPHVHSPLGLWGSVSPQHVGTQMPEYSLLARLFFWFSFMQSGKLGFLGENFVISGFFGGNFHFKKSLASPRKWKYTNFVFFGHHALKFRWWLSCRDGQGYRAQGMGTSQANSSSCLPSVSEMQQILAQWSQDVTLRTSDPPTTTGYVKWSSFCTVRN